MEIPSLVKKFANYTYGLAKKPSAMLLVTGSLGWILSSVAQVIGVARNKKLSNSCIGGSQCWHFSQTIA